GRFRHEETTQVAVHRLRVHMEDERRRRLEGRDAYRRLHDAIPGLAGLLPRRPEAEWTRADRVDALNRGHPTLCAGGVGEDGEHTLRTRGDHRGPSEGHTAASEHPGNKPCGPTGLSTAGRGPTNLDISAVHRTPSEGPTEDAGCAAPLVGRDCHRLRPAQPGR